MPVIDNNVFPMPKPMQNINVFKSFCIARAATAAPVSATLKLILLTNKSLSTVASFLTRVGAPSFEISQSSPNLIFEIENVK